MALAIVQVKAGLIPSVRVRAREPTQLSYREAGIQYAAASRFNHLPSLEYWIPAGACHRAAVRRPVGGR